jgi:tetratricopeptide (TPR) repeat protein/predicted Ser/Thr protein kinase
MTAERWAAVKQVLSAVLDAPPSERSSVLDRLASDHDLRADVESLLSLEEQAADVFRTSDSPGSALRKPGPAPEQIGAYQILREIGRGGMGVVYLGERADGEFHKYAAIKLITGGAPDPGLVRRFRRERQILATLEHPGIARMLDGGTTAQGQLYLVMEYVEGEALLLYCQQHASSVEERLRLFLQVCDAVEYAHQRLIVHRDLKPGNILVTRDGVAKLLDFGLARVTGAPDGDEVTMPLMTPAYASPEQVRGEPYHVSSDVYSLGVILYELLAQRRPYETGACSVVQLAKVICEQEPPPLSAVNPEWKRRLAGDLENITAKALAKESRHRYASVAELAADIRRHLDGLPVRARPSTWRYRLGKWIGRHRIAVPAGAVAALLIAGFGMTAWWEARSAERRFQQVRSLAHSVMYDLHDAIQPLPGSTAARALLLNRAMTYLESMAREAGRRPDLQLEVARGYARIADVQGAVGEANLGEFPAALANYERAQAIYTRLLKASPYDPGLLQEYNRNTNNLSRSFMHDGQLPKALALAQQSVSMSETGMRAQPDNPVSVSGVISSLSALADLYTDQYDFAAATPIRERIEKLSVRHAQMRPGDAESMRTLAIARKRLAALYAVSKRFGEARREYQEAAAIDEASLARRPDDTRAKLDLSYDYSDLGWVSGQLGEYEASVAAYRRTLALRTEAAQADPHDQRAANSVAAAHVRVGKALRKARDLDNSEKEVRLGVAMLQDLVNRGWARPFELAMAYDDLADTLESQCEKKRGGRACFAAPALEVHKEFVILQDLQAQGHLPKADDHMIAEARNREQKLRRDGR